MLHREHDPGNETVARAVVGARHRYDDRGAVAGGRGAGRGGGTRDLPESQEKINAQRAEEDLKNVDEGNRFFKGRQVFRERNAEKVQRVEDGVPGHLPEGTAEVVIRAPGRETALQKFAGVEEKLGKILVGEVAEEEARA